MNTIRNNQKRLKEQLEFERLIANLSARLTTIQSEALEQQIIDILDELRRFFHVDRTAFLRYTAGFESVEVMFTTHGKDLAPLPHDLDIIRQFPVLTRKAIQGETVIIDSAQELEDELITDRQSLEFIGLRSIIVIPVLSDEPVSYGIAIASIEAKHWPMELIPRLKLFGEIVITTLERFRFHRQLVEAENKYRTIADYTYDMESWQDPEGKLLYVSPSCKRITGFTPDEFMKRNSLMDEIIHPEDFQIWDEHRKIYGTNQEYKEFQFRIIDKEGNIRWIEHAHQPVIDGQGQFLGVRSSSRDITDRKKYAVRLNQALEEITELKKKLEAENIYLKDYILPKMMIPGIIAHSEGMKEVMEQVSRVASTDSPVLIIGETGTGKELVARTIHHLSKRTNHVMVTVNCAALPGSLIESELYGREKGAFTGALAKQIGRFEMANNSTIFLDEIGEMPQDLQVKLLRVLQFGEFERLGSPVTHKVNVRIIAATNRDISQALRDGSLRKDLFYRLNVFPISIPPLCERPDDIPPLVWFFINELSERTGKRVDTIPKKEMEKLLRYSWPGNVRELRNVVEHAMIVMQGHVLEIILPQTGESEQEAVVTLEDAERRHIMHVLRMTHWRVRGEGGAAEILGLNESTLRFRMKKLGIKRPD